MARLEWREVNDRLVSTPVKGIEVSVFRNGNTSEWVILKEGKWVKKGVCGDFDTAKNMADQEAQEYLRG